MAMGKPQANNYCIHCSDTATSSHVLNDCIIMQMAKKLMKEYFRHKEWNSLILYEDTYLEYMWWEPKALDHNTYKQVWLVWTEVRRHALECDFLPRFDRFGPLQFTAKVTTAFKKAAETAHYLRYNTAKELCQFVLEKTQSLPHDCHELLRDLRRYR